ncbi:titin-like [Lineus longissimus]|uniref:titin-like n=1 Tax=Lineus longissimus TaxID=88925 RepID=UPI00315CA5B6
MESLPIPEKPTLSSDVTDTSLSISWEVNGNVSNITNYIIYYSAVDDKPNAPSWKSLVTKDAATEFYICDLLPDTSYQFKVSANTKEDQSQPSELSNIIKTTRNDIAQDATSDEDVQTVSRGLIPLAGSPTLASYPQTPFQDTSNPNEVHSSPNEESATNGTDTSMVGVESSEVIQNLPRDNSPLSALQTLTSVPPTQFDDSSKRVEEVETFNYVENLSRGNSQFSGSPTKEFLTQSQDSSNKAEGRSLTSDLDDFIGNSTIDAKDPSRGPTPQHETLSGPSTHPGSVPPTRDSSNTAKGRVAPSEPSNTTSTTWNQSVEIEASKNVPNLSRGPAPEKPTLAGQPTHSSVPLMWVVNGDTSSVTHYTVTYKAVDQGVSLGSAGKWDTFDTKGSECNCVIGNLSAETSFRFCVSSNSKKGSSPPSLISDLICTSIKPGTRAPVPDRPILAGIVTDKSVPLSWKINSSGLHITHFTVICKDASDNGNCKWSLFKTENASTSCAVKYLRPETSYQFGIISHTHREQSKPSVFSEVITTIRNAQNIAPRPLKPQLAGSVSHNHVPLYWNVPDGSAHITHYTLSYKQVGKGPWVFFDTKDSHTTIGNLESCTAYQFRVASNTDRDQSTPSPLSDVISTTSMKCSPRTSNHTRNMNDWKPRHPKLGKPTAAGPVTWDSVPLKWEVMGDRSYITHYTLTYKRSSDKGSWMTITTDDAETSYRVEHLDPGTTYEFRVACHTDDGQSPPSKIAKLTTAKTSKTNYGHLLSAGHGLPIPNTPYVAGTASYNCLTLGWKVHGNTRNITHFTLTYKIVGEKGHWIAVETNDTGKKFTVECLMPNTPYQFRIASNTDYGQSLPSSVSDTMWTTTDPGSMQAKTFSNPPIPKKPKALGAPGHNCIQLTWAVPGNPSHVTHFTLTYKVAGEKDHWFTVETEDTDKAYTVEGLLPKTPYQFRVASNTVQEQSPPSQTSDIIFTSDVLQTSPDQMPPIPCRPARIGPENHNTLTLAWKVDGDASSVTHFTLSYRVISDKPNGIPDESWTTVQTENSDTWFTIENLEPSTLYQIRILANTKDGQIYHGDCSESYMQTAPGSTELAESAVSFESLPVVRPPPCPGTPSLAPEQKPTQKSMSVVWDAETDESHVTHFTLEYKVFSREVLDWEMIEVPGLSREYTLMNLHPATAYLLRIKAHTPTVSSCSSEIGGPFHTESRTRGQIYREHIISISTPVTSDKGMPLYQVPLHLNMMHKEERIRRYEFGPKPAIPKPEKVLLVVGATGAGKSTLINGLFNYVIGVEWTEENRFRLVEESGLFETQHQSQTKMITVYTIYHHNIFKIPFTLTIIDTPGFGDTGGINNDRLIIESIGHLFRRKEYGVDHIDAIGFVAQSSLPRLTPTQKYIFDSILSLFGKDIADNIFLMITFSDSQRPPVLASTSEAKIPYKSHYKFNNSALFAKNDTEDNEFDQMFWKMGVVSFRKFLHDLSTVEGKSLNLTKEVLDERQQLEVYVTGIQQEIHVGLNTLEQYRVEINVVRQHEADIEKNKNFWYSVQEHKMVEVKLNPGQHVTNCITCNRTCHFPCYIPNDADKRSCSAMNSDGNCRICAKNCIWSMHRNVPFRIVVETVTVKKTAEELKKRYEKAQGEKLNAEKLTNKILEDFYNLEVKVLFMTSEVRRGLERLNEIALRPNPLSTVEYLNILIRAERAEAHPGYQQRIIQLENVKAHAKTLCDMAADGYDPFDDFRDVINQAQSAQNRPSFQDAAASFRRRHPFQSFFKSCKGFFGFQH